MKRITVLITCWLLMLATLTHANLFPRSILSIFSKPIDANTLEYFMHHHFPAQSGLDVQPNRENNMFQYLLHPDEPNELGNFDHSTEYNDVLMDSFYSKIVNLAGDQSYCSSARINGLGAGIKGSGVFIGSFTRTEGGRVRIYRVILTNFHVARVLYFIQHHSDNIQSATGELRRLLSDGTPGTQVEETINAIVANPNHLVGLGPKYQWSMDLTPAGARDGTWEVHFVDNPDPSRVLPADLAILCVEDRSSVTLAAAGAKRSLLYEDIAGKNVGIRSASMLRFDSQRPYTTDMARFTDTRLVYMNQNYYFLSGGNSPRMEWYRKEGNNAYFLERYENPTRARVAPVVWIPSKMKLASAPLVFPDDPTPTVPITHTRQTLKYHFCMVSELGIVENLPYQHALGIDFEFPMDLRDLMSPLTYDNLYRCAGLPTGGDSGCGIYAMRKTPPYNYEPLCCAINISATNDLDAGVPWDRAAKRSSDVILLTDRIISNISWTIWQHCLRGDDKAKIVQMEGALKSVKAITEEQTMPAGPGRLEPRSGLAATASRLGLTCFSGHAMNMQVGTTQASKRWLRYNDYSHQYVGYGLLPDNFILEPATHQENVFTAIGHDAITGTILMIHDELGRYMGVDENNHLTRDATHPALFVYTDIYDEHFPSQDAIYCAFQHLSSGLWLAGGEGENTPMRLLEINDAKAAADLPSCLWNLSPAAPVAPPLPPPPVVVETIPPIEMHKSWTDYFHFHFNSMEMALYALHDGKRDTSEEDVDHGTGLWEVILPYSSAVKSVWQGPLPMMDTWSIPSPSDPLRAFGLPPSEGALQLNALAGMPDQCIGSLIAKGIGSFFYFPETRFVPWNQGADTEILLLVRVPKQPTANGQAFLVVGHQGFRDGRHLKIPLSIFEPAKTYFLKVLFTARFRDAAQPWRLYLGSRFEVAAENGSGFLNFFTGANAVEQIVDYPAYRLQHQTSGDNVYLHLAYLSRDGTILPSECDTNVIVDRVFGFRRNVPRHLITLESDQTEYEVSNNWWENIITVRYNGVSENCHMAVYEDNSNSPLQRQPLYYLPDGESYFFPVPESEYNPWDDYTIRVHSTNNFHVEMLDDTTGARLSNTLYFKVTNPYNY